jgi:hypothetical protein
MCLDLMNMVRRSYVAEDKIVQNILHKGKRMGVYNLYDLFCCFNAHDNTSVY